MKILLTMLICLLLTLDTYAHTKHKCEASAQQQAYKLLTFHFEIEDNRIEIDQKVKLLPAIKNPVGKDFYDVLEVMGYIYKGRYRMRFIYAQNMDECLLMGQEILEYADIFAKP